MKTPSYLLMIALVSGFAGNAPSASALVAAATPASKVEESPKLPKSGVNRERPDGSWLNVEVVGTRLVVRFFDKKKKPVAPDVVRGLAQFRYSTRKPESAPLTVQDQILATPAKLRPPHNFLLLLTLFSAEDGRAETHSFRYP